MAVGLELQWVQWTHGELPAFSYGIENRPAVSDATQGALALMLTLDFAPFR